jgi:hypothetical protein
MIYRNIYFEECNHAKIIFKKIKLKKRKCSSIFLFEVLTFEICLLTYASPVRQFCLFLLDIS